MSLDHQSVLYGLSIDAPVFASVSKLLIRAASQTRARNWGVVATITVTHPTAERRLAREVRLEASQPRR